MKALLAVLLALPMAAQGYNPNTSCTRAMLGRGGNVVLGFGVTWGGAKMTGSAKWGATLGMTVGGLKYALDRDNDRASRGTNFTLNTLGVMLGAALAKHQMRPEFATAPKPPEN